MGGKERPMFSCPWAGFGRAQWGIKTNSITAQHCCSLGPITVPCLPCPFLALAPVCLLSLLPSLALSHPHACPTSLCPWPPPCHFAPTSLPGLSTFDPAAPLWPVAGNLGMTLSKDLDLLSKHRLTACPSPLPWELHLWSLQWGPNSPLLASTFPRIFHWPYGTTEGWASPADYFSTPANKSSCDGSQKVLDGVTLPLVHHHCGNWHLLFFNSQNGLNSRIFQEIR